jgi:hypothetical protein
MDVLNQSWSIIDPTKFIIEHTNLRNGCEKTAIRSRLTIGIGEYVSYGWILDLRRPTGMAMYRFRTHKAQESPLESGCSLPHRCRCGSRQRRLLTEKAVPSLAVVHWACLVIAPRSTLDCCNADSSHFLLMLGKGRPSDSRSVGTTTLIATRNGDGKKGRRPSPRTSQRKYLVVVPF